MLKQGGYLQLSKSSTDHNHPVSKKAFQMNIRQRRLNDDEKKKAGHLMAMQVNKKILQQTLQEETGKMVQLKDLANIEQKLKGPSISFEQVIHKLQDKYGCSVNVLEENNVLQGIFFQDEIMKEMYSHFPEILFIDGTYKLLNIRFVCYIFLVEDGNGKNFQLSNYFLFTDLQ